MDAVRASDKARAASDKAKVARKSKKQNKVADDDSGDDDVVVITNPSEDTEMADASKGLNASMHAPKADSPDAKSIRFRKDKDKKSPKDKKDRLITASSIKSELNKAPKCPRLEHPVVDLREETIEERNSRVIGNASVSKYTSLVPFLELEKSPVDVIVSVVNFLRSEMSTLEHNVHFFASQYKFTSLQFEAASHLLRSRMEPEDKQMVDAPIDSGSVPETVAGPSSAPV
ncbi:hypothetical protein MPER_13183 [Moniliophthora perniciosa FA553]|nr:hypothetical protein MPER_13183 [Moniliophthora perniciosa FA553]